MGNFKNDVMLRFILSTKSFLYPPNPKRCKIPTKAYFVLENKKRRNTVQAKNIAILFLRSIISGLK